jgi:hypothetical protein
LGVERLDADVHLKGLLPPSKIKPFLRIKLHPCEIESGSHRAVNGKTVEKVKPGIQTLKERLPDTLRGGLYQRLKQTGDDHQGQP